MPNHVTNRVVAPPQVISRLVGSCDGNLLVDFERIIPKPEYIPTGNVSLHIESAAQIALGIVDFGLLKHPGTAGAAFQEGDYGTAANALRAGHCARQIAEGPMAKDFSEYEFETFVNYMRAYRQCGLMNWYDWSISMWGTKWNAYSTEVIGDTEVVFETAWSAPHPVMERLNELCESEFIHEWADEDTGNNVGFRLYDGKGSFQEKELSETKEGYELAFKLRPDDKEDYEFDGVTYRYCEDSE